MFLLCSRDGLKHKREYHSRDNTDTFLKADFLSHLHALVEQFFPPNSIEVLVLEFPT